MNYKIPRLDLGFKLFNPTLGPFTSYLYALPYRLPILIFAEWNNNKRNAVNIQNPNFRISAFLDLVRLSNSSDFKQ